MRPAGDSMKTFTLLLPFRACSAAEPVSPLVAPRMLSVRPWRSSTDSKSCPRSCIAMSLDASVGPFEQASRWKLGESVLRGVISAVPKTAAV